MPATYQLLCEVKTRLLPSGLALSLKLQLKTQRPGTSGHVVSWRTLWKPGSKNRRQYMSAGQPWRTTIEVARTLLNELEQKGGLDQGYFYPSHNPCRDFNKAWLNRSMLPGDSWGTNPYICALEDANTDWRRLLIANRQTREATFRSITRDKSYSRRKKLDNDPDWDLDNDMPDMTVQSARIFLDELRKI